MIFTDAHIHLAHCNMEEILDFAGTQTALFCSSCHTKNELERTLEIAHKIRKQNDASLALASFGVHPQNPDKVLLDTLESALRADEIAAIGEIGFDLFTPAFASRLPEQTAVWNIQLELAAQYNKPVIVHCRKAIHLLFKDAQKLAKLPAVVFHSCPPSPIEAQSFLKRGVNAYFSLGKPLLNCGKPYGNKRAQLCAKQLPLAHLLTETDAPYQTLKGETASQARDIMRVDEALSQLRELPINLTTEALHRNFCAAYMLTEKMP
ncbi:MAG: TatD family hydrolase [Treponemataceae bacterium]|nr:MAG: TatD family hydrolase [Treponemataceae bacterium]